MLRMLRMTLPKTWRHSEGKEQANIANGMEWQQKRAGPRTGRHQKAGGHLGDGLEPEGRTGSLELMFPTAIFVSMMRATNLHADSLCEPPQLWLRRLAIAQVQLAIIDSRSLPDPRCPGSVPWWV